MNLRDLLYLTALFLLITLSACQRAEQKTAASPEAQRYELTGKVVSVDKGKRKAKIEHDEIPGYMKAMTMDFSIKDEWVIRELEPNDKVSAVLVIEKGGDYWLESVGIMKAPRDAATGNVVQPTQAGAEKIGVEVPDFKLVNQDGKRIGFKDFLGKTTIVTFIFTRCPDAEMCPLMSLNFSDLAKELEKSPQLAANTRLLSVSFDPEYDTPQKLREYGVGYFGKDVKPNFELWQLATGSEKEIKDVTDFFGVTAAKADDERIVHNLRTVIVKPDGKIAKIFAGNNWKPADILRELQS